MGHDRHHSAGDRISLIEGVARQGGNLETLLDALPECVKLVSLSGAILYVNRTGLDSLGLLEPGQIVGAPVLDFIGRSHRDAFARAADAVRQGNNQSLVYETSACGGPSPRWVRAKLSPLRDDSGKVAYLLVITRDISERKLMEERLEDYEIQLRTIIDSEPEGVVLHEADGSILDLNPAAHGILQLSNDSGLGQPIFRYLDRRFHDAYRELIRRVFAGEKGRLELKTASASPNWIEVHSAPLYNSRSVVVGLLAIVEDISARKSREEQVSEHRFLLAHGHRQNLLRELGRLMAHEINQPLCAIISYAEMCAQKLDGTPDCDPEVGELVDLIGFHASRVNDVIRQMRVLLRKRPLQREAAHIGGLMESAVELFAPVCRKHDIEVELRVGEGLPPVFVDTLEVEQVLVSVVRNAIQALSQIPKDRRIVLSAQQESGQSPPEMVTVMVRDNGPGIDEAIREKALRPFFSVKGKGIGLGLSLSRSIVEMHGGQFGIANQTESPGVLVEFTLPVCGIGEVSPNAYGASSLHR